MDDNKEESFSHEFKVLLLGDSAVGKTCYFLRITENVYMESHLSTIGIDTAVKFFDINDKDTNEKKRIKLRINDTAGQDRFRAITSSYYKQANGILLLYDVTSRSSFEHINDWVAQVNEKATKDVKIFIVANKIDLRGSPDVECISTEEGQELANKLHLKFKEGSAKENINIYEMFEEITQDIYENEKHNDTENGGKQLTIAKTKKKCC